MPKGKYDHKGIKHNRNDLHPEFCRCGVRWGEHPNGWILWGMKPNCCVCGEEIGVTKYREFIPNQCQKRYIEKGNYCDKCNAKCHTTKSSNLSFSELFKNKQK